MAKSLRQDVEELKFRVSVLEKQDPEGELTEATKRRLAKARTERVEDCVELHDLARSLNIKLKKVH